MIPPKAAIADPMKKTASTLRSTSIPMTLAVSMSCATARTANPNEVCWMTNHSAAKIATVPPRIRQSTPDTVTPPTATRPASAGTSKAS